MASFILFVALTPILISSVSGDVPNGCLVYDFESNLEELQHGTQICESFPAWTIGNYSEVGVKSPNPVSESFIAPNLALSCTSSERFQATSGGKVEINVYMEGNSATDLVTAFLMMTSSSGNDMTVASESRSPTWNDLDGWHKLTLMVPDNLGEFEAYIAFLGTKSEDSIFLVDSFRYVPEAKYEKDCVIYEPVDQCVTYNFESDYTVLFSEENYLCDGYQSWNLDNYTSAGVESPDAKSSLFISPTKTLSCVSSFIFNMEPNGVIEAKVFMESASELDYIVLIAQKVTSEEVDTVAGYTMYYPNNRMFVSGWNVLSFPINDFAGFVGYLILLGSAHDGATVLVDSFRYIPPTLSSADESCTLY